MNEEDGLRGEEKRERKKMEARERNEDSPHNIFCIKLLLPRVLCSTVNHGSPDGFIRSTILS